MNNRKPRTEAQILREISKRIEFERQFAKDSKLPEDSPALAHHYGAIIALKDLHNWIKLRMKNSPCLRDDYDE